MQTADRLTRTARGVVRLARIANWTFVAGTSAGLLASFALPAQFMRLASEWFPDSDVVSAMTGMRLLLVLGLFMGVVTVRLLSALADVIASTAAGDPFHAANAERLQVMAWCLLALQLCEIPGALIASGFPELGAAGPSGAVSIAGWMSVLLVFVLARVFAAGAAMRAELETVI
jgi:hypothetical protein